MGLFKSARDQIQTPPSRPGPLGLSIGASLRIDTQPLRVLAGLLNFDLPAAPLTVAGRGRIELGGGSYVHRYYTDGLALLQVLCIGGETAADMHEIMLYVPHTSYYPQGRAWRIWEGEQGRVGQATFRTDDGTVYERIWLGDEPGWVPPVHFEEQVTSPKTAATIVPQNAMLYGRRLGGDEEFGEFLLAAIEEHDGDRGIEVMLGVHITPDLVKSA